MFSKISESEFKETERMMHGASSVVSFHRLNLINLILILEGGLKAMQEKLEPNKHPPASPERKTGNA